MAKRINILSAGGDIPFADNGLKLSKSIRISEIEYHDGFKSLFSIDDELLKRIVKSINDNKYDNSQPVHIWIYTDENGITHKYLIDGHTRVKAAEEAGLETIPYYEHKFNSFEEAYKYVLGLQVNRRNLGGSELLKNISKLYGTDFIQNAEGKKSEAIAEILGISDRTVEKGLYVNKNADEDTLAKIDLDELSVDKAYKQLKAEEKAVATKQIKSNDDFEEDFNPFEDNIDDLSESLNDNEGNPRGLNFNHSDGIERPTNNLSPEEDSERTRERKQAYLQGLSEGFYKALVYACSEIAKGRTPGDVYTDDRVSDLSPSVIEKFELPDDAEDIVGRW